MCEPGRYAGEREQEWSKRHVRKARFLRQKTATASPAKERDETAAHAVPVSSNGHKSKMQPRGEGCIRTSLPCMANLNWEAADYDGPQPPTGELLLATTPTPIPTGWEVNSR